MSASLRPVISIRLFRDEKCFGPGVAQLLHQVQEHHSLRKAAMTMEMAYSKAWTVVRRCEQALGYPLLNLSAGGKGGGGASLTDEALALLKAYDRYCNRLRAVAEDLFREEFPGV